MAPVHEAARGNDVEALRELLAAEPGLAEAEDMEGMLPLHHACEWGSLEAVHVLLDRGAGINRSIGHEAGHYTPLMVACVYGCAAVVALLLARGADPTLRAAYGRTALICAAIGLGGAGSDHVAVMRLLLDDGRVGVDARTTRGETALLEACYYGQADRARLLLVEGGAHHTIADGQGRTPTAIAQLNGHQACAELLQWFEGELERAFLLSKARALVDDTESIAKAPEKAGARTEAEAQQAREEAAPAYVKRRVEEGEALPRVEVVGQQLTSLPMPGAAGAEEEEEEEERAAVVWFVVMWLKEDLFMELMEGLRYR